jgi:ferricrocin synthase
MGELDVVLRHIVDRPDAEVLAFTGPLMSVCGLPPFMAQQPESISQPSNGSVEAGKTVWSPVEDTIRRTLSEVSGMTVSSVLKKHSIYHLGLDSISAIKVSGLLRQRGVRLAFRDMLRAKSISEMALMLGDAPSTQVPEVEPEGIEQQHWGFNVAGVLAKADIEVTEVETVLPATAMQVHFLSVWQNTQGNVFYPEFRFRLTGPVDVDTVLARWSELMKEMPILRTTFVATAAKEVPILQVVRQASTGHQYTSFAVHPDGDSCIVSLKIHHALYDAISLPALLERLQGSSMGRRTPRGAAQQALAWNQFAATRLNDSETRARERFWTDYLGGATSKPRPANKTCDNTRVSTFHKSALPVISRLKSACSERGLSIQAVFFAAYAKLLASSNATAITDTETISARDVIFGIYLANCTETVSEASVLTTYPTLALVPLRVHLGSEQGESILEVAERVQRDLHAISDPINVAVGLWEIQAWTGVVVDSFVNFLGAAPKRRWGEGPGGFELMEPKTEQGGERPLRYSEPEELKGNLVRDAYPVSTSILLPDESGC